MKKGMTMAEVLVVIVAIGVVSSLALPVLFTRSLAIENKKALKKGFAEISNAYAVEFAAKAFPSSTSEGDKIVNVIKHNMNVKNYLACINGKCEQKFDNPVLGDWAVIEDNIAFKIVEGKSNCATKADISLKNSSDEAQEATCFAIIIDGGCVVKNNTDDKETCFEIPEATDDDIKKIKDNDFKGSQMRVFVSSTGITSGNSEKTVAGIITAE